MKKIILIMAYYGTLPNFFPVWLESVKNNPTVDFCFFSDCIDKSSVPQNVVVVDISGEEFKKRIREKFDFNAEELDNFFNWIDTKKDNAIDFEEFEEKLTYTLKPLTTIFPSVILLELFRYIFWNFLTASK